MKLCYTKGKQWEMVKEAKGEEGHGRDQETSADDR